jgi:hypothetical protein
LIDRRASPQSNAHAWNGSEGTESKHHLTLKTVYGPIVSDLEDNGVTDHSEQHADVLKQHISLYRLAMNQF